MDTNNKKIVTNFIEDIWNQNQFGKIEEYIHPDFVDHSLPDTLPANKEGLKLWIKETGKSFDHKTVIEEMVCEENKVMVKIRMHLKHTGTWRSIEPTGIELHTFGYRQFKLKVGKIIEHWSVIDGQAIENQLKNASHGCKIAE